MTTATLPEGIWRPTKNAAHKDRHALRRRTGELYQVVRSEHGPRYKARPTDPMPAYRDTGPFDTHIEDTLRGMRFLEAVGWQEPGPLETLYSYHTPFVCIPGCLLPRGVEVVTRPVFHAEDGSGEGRLYRVKLLDLFRRDIGDWSPMEVGCGAFDDLLAHVSAQIDGHLTHVYELVEYVNPAEPKAGIRVCIRAQSVPQLHYTCAEPPPWAPPREHRVTYGYD